MNDYEALEILAAALRQKANQSFVRSVPTFRIDEFRRRRHITYQDDLADAARLVISGSAELYTWRTDGAQFLLQTAELGDWIGLPETLVNGPYLADAIPDPFCVTMTFGLSATRDLASLFPESISKLLAQGYYRLHGHLRFPSARERIIWLLVPRVDENSEVIITQDEIAHRLTLSRETVNRILKELEAEGLVETGRGRIAVLKPILERFHGDSPQG